MRLTPFEIQTIQQTHQKIFGDKSRIMLFGSRVDDSKKGGDIDLYILPDNLDNALEKKIKFLSTLDKELGEQKIDVVIATDKNRTIEQQALASGVELDIDALRLEKILHECDKHLQRINEAYTDMGLFMPLNAKKYEKLPKNQVQAIDQYLFRFAKLQDSMGEKLFRAVLNKYQENSDKLPFLDVIRKLESYLNIDMANEWQDLRKIHNQLAHEYEDDAIEMANRINLIYAKKDVIERIYLTIKEAALKIF